MQELTGQRITLGVCGGVAAYKSAELVRLLTRAGAEVDVILTAAAERFIGTAQMRALTRRHVYTSLWEEPAEGHIAHITLAQQCGLFLVAPATADIIGRLANGLADDLLSTALLAADRPVLLAPAMNTSMLQHPSVQKNLQILRQQGVVFVEPGTGELACGTVGEGRMAEPEAIAQAAVAMLTPKDLRGVRLLITAGATVEHLDDVRIITNPSTGRMGMALAQAALLRGAQVTVLSGPGSVPPPVGVQLVPVGTTDELLQASLALLGDHDVYIAAGAPSDYRPVTSTPGKRAKDSGRWQVELEPTPDVLTAVSQRAQGRIVVGFSAYMGGDLQSSREKLVRKNLHLVAANDVSQEGAGFRHETNSITLLWPDGRTELVPRQSKLSVAHRILDAVAQIRQETASS